MKSEELSFQSARVENGRKIMARINEHRDLHKRIRESPSFALYSNGCAIQYAAYELNNVNHGIKFEGLSKEQIREAIEFIRSMMLKNVSAKIADLQDQFDAI